MKELTQLRRRIIFFELAQDAQNAGGEGAATRLQRYWEQIAPLITQYGIKVVGVLVFLFFAWIIAGWVRRFSLNGLTKAKVDLTLSQFISNILKWLVLLLAGLACLGAFGIETTAFAAVLAAAGFAVGIAFQGTLSNFAAGMMLLVFRPFKIGDVVNVAGVTGKVNEIELFTTTVDTPDNRRMILPNGSIFGSAIENISYHATRRVDVAVGTDYSTDLDRTREVLMKAAKSVENTLGDPGPGVVLCELGGSSIDWSVRVWVNADDYWAVREALTRAVKVALDEANIGIPFPQMDVHLDGAGPAAS